ncbi:LuxR C-terminal-related transcriptional regulator [Sphingomonas sp. NIBR02145]|uniref:response regulator transcription factor n=1 Tax=Sphingomonas sp. NIBR02145 TaxID=3014784 RepID=UPI0022B434C4|nr:LuxR C-terminal-related transcriptional regulator [Sphingomonas sp. NIBR02145]WHU04313.1 PAS domain-containing protein [Sphingomonas sp. NIBR02145]
MTDPRADDNPIIAANRAFERLTGYCENELVGRNCRILAGPDTDPVKRAALREAIASATPTMIELVNYRKDGSNFLNGLMIAPVLDDDRRLVCFVGSQMEIDRAPRQGIPSSAAERLSVLTPQQQTVLRLVARGWRNRQIAEELGLTEKTVKIYRSALVKRLGLATSGEAMRLAIEAGF